ncbi:MAG: hypothetical protein U1E28_10970 [Beijerinckiaceae bacterium]
MNRADALTRTLGLVASVGAAGLLLACVVARMCGARFMSGDIELIACVVLLLALLGATLLVLDALQKGFGALDSFFREALDRSERRAREESRAAAERARRSPVGAQPARPTEHGVIADRPYILYGDGAVAIETLFGVRRFASMQEAREFIGA